MFHGLVWFDIFASMLVKVANRENRERLLFRLYILENMIIAID